MKLLVTFRSVATLPLLCYHQLRLKRNNFSTVNDSQWYGIQTFIAELTRVLFNDPLHTLQVISDTIFPLPVSLLVQNTEN